MPPPPLPHRYVRPVLLDESSPPTLRLTSAKHPVLGALLPQYTPNDLHMQVRRKHTAHHSIAWQAHGRAGGRAGRMHTRAQVCALQAASCSRSTAPA